MDRATETHSINHFSHQHPLQAAVGASPTGNITCSGCNLQILSGKDYFHCETCSFSLHRTCSNMPRKTRHPAHPNHCLNLLVNPDLSLNCKACGHFLSGFCYSCSECSVSYHVLCSALPLSLAVSSHPHDLRIEFSPPYDFTCDLCQNQSHSGWLYRCGFCELDAHVSCAFSDQRDYDGIESNELMQLVQQGVMESNSPFLEVNDEFQLSLKRVRNKDEEQNVTSYQCSSCFSIELLKSYECQEFIALPENEEAKIKQENRKTTAVFNPLYIAEKNWVNELESFNGYEDGRKFEKDSKANGFDGRLGSKNHTILRSNTGSSRRSGGWKLLGCFRLNKV